MKKLAAILLMAVFMFNLFGYKLYVHFALQHADKKLEAAVENAQYDDAGLISITKAINLPYYNNTDEYTRADGEVEINGVYYKYVKYRIHNNQLEMLCLPNTQKTNIQKAKADYFSATADIQNNSNGKNKAPDNTQLKKSFTDFELYAAANLQAAGALHVTPYPVLYNFNLGLLHKATVEQPPDAVAA
jgi:hypothetical protein